MSRFISQKHAALTPYVPGEQPRARQYRFNCPASAVT